MAAPGASLRSDVAVESAVPALDLPLEESQATASPVEVGVAAASAEAGGTAPRLVRDRPPAPARPRPAAAPREKIIEEDEGASSARRRRRKERDEGEATSAHPSGPVMVSEGMTVREFAEKLGVLAKDLIQRLMKRGVMATINHVLDVKTATELATELGVEIMQVSFEEEVQLQKEIDQPNRRGDLKQRAPVVTVMGHVDHGKTSLLDRIRQTRVAAGESGGITQHIGAYHATINGRAIVFLDTPGHEAFTKLRARGAKVTDIVVLVVAADDSVMAQTIEAINHAKAGNVAVVVAINKIDKANANVDRVKRDLANNGIMLEEWGGDVPSAQVSAIKGQGVDELLELILLTADLLELKADPDLAAQAVVLEARKDAGRGSVATVLVQDGTLRIGDVFVSGSTWGKVRSMTDERGLRVTAGGPSTPVEVTGFAELPNAGDNLQAVDSEQRARSIAEFRQQEERRRELLPTHGSLSLDQLFGRIQEGEVQDLPIVLKTDVQGSNEVLKDALVALSTSKVKVKIVHGGRRRHHHQRRHAGGCLQSDHRRLQRPTRAHRRRSGGEGRRRHPHPHRHLRAHRRAQEGDDRAAQADRARGEPRPRRGARDVQDPQDRHHRRLPRGRRHHPAQWQGPPAARQRRGLRGADLLAAAIQGGRLRGAQRLRLRYRARTLPGREARGLHRVLRSGRGGGDACRRACRSRNERAHGTQPPRLTSRRWWGFPCSSCTSPKRAASRRSAAW